MKIDSSLVRSITLSSCFLLQATITAASSSTNHHNHQNQRESLQATLEAARYSTLPPTVFAPGGRLHGVERVAKEALLLDVDGGDEDVSCGVLALHCRGANSDNDGDGNIQNDDNGDFAVMVGIGATSPFLNRDESYLRQQQSSPQQMDNDSMSAVEDTNEMGEFYLPLQVDETTATSTISTPLSILSPTIIAGAGGKAIDSIILLRRTMEVALSMYANENGGVDWFVSHSLEGTDRVTSDANDSRSSLRPIMGGVAGVDVSSLVRRVADMAQSSTQSLGGRYGRMLSSSLVAIGVRPSNPNNKGGTATTHNDPHNDSLILWRVDPTGQFWRLDASAVGRGAMNAESELLQRVRSWRMKQQTEQHGEEESECEVLHDDVRAYLGSLSAEKAVEVATDCLVNGIMKSKKVANNSNDSKMMSQLEQGLRKRVQAVVIRSNEFGQSKPCIEIV